MPVDPEEGLVTDLMLGLMVVFGVDIVALVGFMWLTNNVSTAVFGGVTALVVGGFGGWIGWRWRELRRLQSTDDPDRTALEELKHQYAAGEISEAAFERRLDRLVEVDETVAEPATKSGDHSVDRSEETAQEH